jgi:chromate reductase, NAD(P)H dehydrogenase (quinone)
MIFGYRNAHIYPERVFIPGIGQKFNASGVFADASINERLQKQAVGFAAFASRF